MAKENFDRKKISLINVISFLSGFLGAFLIYILSSYFAQVSGADRVGVLYLVSYAVVLFSLFYLQRLIHFIGKARALYLCLGILILTSALLTRMEVSWTSLCILLLFVVASSVMWVVIDILLEGFSRDKSSGRIRGFNLTIMNAGLLLAPFLSTTVLDRFDFQGVFFVLLIGYIVVFLIALVGFRNDNTVVQERTRLLHTVGKMLREKDLLRIYYISFAMEFFYSIMLIYTPLYLLSLGFSWQEIGFIFTVMLIPFVFLQYPIGLLADKRYGEKELIIACLALTFASTLVIGFVTSQSVFVWAVLLFLTRVGICGIEVLRDAYFYKQIDGNDMDVIAFFRTTASLAYITGSALSAIFLLFFPLQGVFFLIAFVIFLAVLASLPLKDTPGEAEERGT